ncbi:MAG: hypothetical protein GXP06_06275 [Alphaproteobacteria bacterium]|nr:hypothetical protein [Alphaproteobacteria bacterium]
MQNIVDRILHGDRGVFGIDTGLSQNLLTEFFFFLLTVFIVDLLRRRSEKHRYKTAEHDALIDACLDPMSDFFGFSIERPGPRKHHQTIKREAENTVKEIDKRFSNNSLVYVLGDNHGYKRVRELMNTVLWLLEVYIDNSAEGEISKKYQELSCELRENVLRLIFAFIAKKSVDKKMYEQIVQLVSELNPQPTLKSEISKQIDEFKRIYTASPQRPKA